MNTSELLGTLIVMMVRERLVHVASGWLGGITPEGRGRGELRRHWLKITSKKVVLK